MWVTTGFVTYIRPGVFQGHFDDERANGLFFYLAVKENYHVLIACVGDDEFAAWIKTRNGELSPQEHREVMDIVEDNGLDPEAFKPAPNYDKCAEKLSGV